MVETIKTIERNDLGLKWDIQAWQIEGREFFLVALTKIEEPEDEMAKRLGLKHFKTLHAEEFNSFFKANEHYKEIIYNWEEYAK